MAYEIQYKHFFFSIKKNVSKCHNLVFPNKKDKIFFRKWPLIKTFKKRNPFCNSQTMHKCENCLFICFRAVLNFPEPNSSLTLINKYFFTAFHQKTSYSDFQLYCKICHCFTFIFDHTVYVIIFCLLTKVYMFMQINIYVIPK